MDGDFDEKRLGVILKQVSRSRLNGALCLENAERVTAVLYFNAGHLCYAELGGRPLPLLDMLVALGALAPADARTARAQCRSESDRELVCWLLQQRLVTVNKVLLAAQERLLESVRRVCAWTRVMKQANTYPSKKTLVFVAWPQGERWENFSTWEVMNATRGLNQLSVESVIELSGVGAGDGHAIALGPGTSFRLTRLFQGAADQLGNSLTMRGRSPHFDQPAAPGFGGRQALSVYVSWDGSNRDAHTVLDALEAIDPGKLERTSQTVLLALSVLGRHVEY